MPDHIEKRRVFFVEVPRVGLGNAAQFGDVEYIFNNGERVSVWSPNYQDAVIKSLRDKAYDPEKDYLAVAGNLMAVVQSVVAMVDAYDCIRVLFWDAPALGYRASTLELWEAIGGEQCNSKS